MATNGTNFTYNDAARREDLLDVMTNIDPTEDRLFRLFGRERATSTLHEWPLDSLETVGDNAQPEGGEAPTDNANNPTRDNNITQIFAKTARVSGSEEAADSAGFNSRMAYEIMKKTKAMNNDIEYAIVRGSKASGLATTAGSNGRRLNGIKNAITTNSVNYSGATFTEDKFNDMVQVSWDQGGNIDTALTSMKGKRRISKFTAGSTKNVESEDKRLTNVVSVYEADASNKPVKLYAHRYVTMSGDYTGAATPGFDVIMLQDDTWRTAMYRDPFVKDLASTGDYEQKELITELTIEYRAEQANVLGKVFF